MSASRRVTLQQWQEVPGTTFTVDCFSIRSNQLPGRSRFLIYYTLTTTVASHPASVQCNPCSPPRPAQPHLCTCCPQCDPPCAAHSRKISAVAFG